MEGEEKEYTREGAARRLVGDVRDWEQDVGWDTGNKDEDKKRDEIDQSVIREAMEVLKKHFGLDDEPAGDKDQKAKEERYERLVYDQARDISDRFRGDPDGMRKHLGLFRGNKELVDAVVEAMNDPDYEEIMYRGKMCDEGVIEALKNYLRAFYDF